ncbi:unnamed protein product, partial [Sphacelaria rigidula]
HFASTVTAGLAATSSSPSHSAVAGVPGVSPAASAAASTSWVSSSAAAAAMTAEPKKGPSQSSPAGARGMMARSPGKNTTTPTGYGNQQHQQHQPPGETQRLFSIFDISSDEEDEATGDCDGGGGAVADGKNGSRSHESSIVAAPAGATGVNSDGDTGNDDDNDDDRWPLPGPCSDGGWLESKRCAPPNLKSRSRSSTSSGGNGNLKSNGMSGTAEESSSGGNGRRRLGCGENSGNFMSDTEDYGGITRVHSTRKAEGGGAAAGRTGLKRGRTPPIVSPGDTRSYYSSDDGNNNYGNNSSNLVGGDFGGGDGYGGGDRLRGGKTGRNERYTAPVPRRPRSPPLSLSPLRFTAFDSDYDSAEDDDSDNGSHPTMSSKHGTTGRSSRRHSREHVRSGGDGFRGASRSLGNAEDYPTGGKGERGGERERKLGHPDDGAPKADREGRGLKRGLEHTLHDRIEAMRVASDDEIAQSDRNSLDKRGRQCIGGRVGKKNGYRAGRSADHEETADDEWDEEDLRPHISDPPWLGPLQAYDLGGGAFINPSINRYLREYQRDGVQWMYGKFMEGKGGVLGDDMGLGKTVQTISLISAILRKT